MQVSLIESGVIQGLVSSELITAGIQHYLVSFYVINVVIVFCAILDIGIELTIMRRVYIVCKVKLVVRRC